MPTNSTLPKPSPAFKGKWCFETGEVDSRAIINELFAGRAKSGKSPSKSSGK